MQTKTDMLTSRSLGPYGILPRYGIKHRYTFRNVLVMKKWNFLCDIAKRINLYRDRTGQLRQHRVSTIITKHRIVLP